MNALSRLLCIAALALATFANAQASYSPATIFTWVGNAIGEGFTNQTMWFFGTDTHTNASGTGIMQIDKVGQSVPVLISLASSTNKLGTNVFAFVYSVDGSTYDLANPKLIGVENGTPVAGGVQQTIFTNLPTYEAGWMKLYYMSNFCPAAAGGTALTFTTNITVMYGQKFPNK